MMPTSANEYNDAIVRKINDLIQVLPEPGKISDGYHSFDELYEHRCILFIVLANRVNPYHEVWRSNRHSDGSVMPGWFLLGINSEYGKQITYHLPVKYMSMCAFARPMDRAPEFDGHNSEDVIERLINILS